MHGYDNLQDFFLNQILKTHFNFGLTQVHFLILIGTKTSAFIFFLHAINWWVPSSYWSTSNVSVLPIGYQTPHQKQFTRVWIYFANTASIFPMHFKNSACMCTVQNMKQFFCLCRSSLYSKFAITIIPRGHKHILRAFLRHFYLLWSYVHCVGDL
jgi:hypothetical protein